MTERRMNMKTFKKILCTLLVVVMCLTAAPLDGFVGIDWPKLPRINFGEIKLPELDFSEWFSNKAQAVEYTSDLYTYTISDGNATITKCDTSVSGTVNIPNVLDGYNVVGIGSSAFSNCTSITSIIIPDNIKHINYGAFALCSKLTSIDLGNVEVLGALLFNGCTSLKSIIIPNTVKTAYEATGYFNNGYYSNCGPLANSGIKNVVFESGIENIPAYICSQCITLESVTLPEKEDITNGYKIGALAFYNTKIESIDLPETTTEIGGSAFGSCKNLEEIYINDNVTSIGGSAFSDCVKLTKAVLGNSVKILGSSVFSGCINLSSIDLGNVETLGSMIFSGCTSLKSIIIPSTVKTAYEATGYFNNGYYSNCGPFANSGIKNVVFEKGIENIPAYICSQCITLESVAFPLNEETNINYDIRNSAFYSCGNLENVYYEGTESQWKEITILSNNEDLTNATIHYNTPLPDINTAKSDSIVLSQNSIILDAEDVDEYTVTAKYYDVNGMNIMNSDIKWTTSDSSIISISDIKNGNNSRITFKARSNGSTKLIARYGGKKAECYIFVKEIEPQLSVDVKNLKQNDDTFTFDVVCSNWYGIDCSTLTQEQREKATATNCYIDVTLPEGFSFYKDKDVKKSVYVINSDAKLAPGDSKENSCTIYKIKKNAENKMVVTAKASNASNYKETVKLFVDGRDLTQEDRKIITDNIKVTIDVAQNYKKIQQRGGKIEYGQYTANQKLTNNEIPIQVTISNIIPGSYSEYEEYLKNNQEFDYNISKLNLVNIKGFKSVSLDKSSVKKALKAGESVTLYGKAVLENNYLPMPENEKSRDLSAKVEVVSSSGEKRTNSFYVTVRNISYKPVIPNIETAGKELAKASNTVCNLMCLASDFGISLEQCEHIAKLVTIELAMFSLPETTLRKKIDNFALETFFGYKENLGAKTGSFTVTVPITVDGEKVELDLINTVTLSEFNGTTNAKFSSIRYEAYKIKKNFWGEKREPEPYKDGTAGVAAYANLNKLISSIEDYVLEAVSDVTDVALGDPDDVAEFLFGKCAHDILIEAGYSSFFEYGWSVYSKIWKDITVECPVDVYIYNSNDELCGSVVNNIVTEMCDEVKLEVINDDKIIRLLGDGYYIKTIATAEGTMNVTVSESDYNNGAKRILGYTNLPLVVGTEYIQNYGEGFNVDSSVYNIVYEDGSIQFADDELMLLADNFCLHENTYFTGGSSATCTTTGKAQDEYCSDCSRLITEGTVIDKLEHSYVSVVTANTCTSTGYTTNTCSSCGYGYTSDITEKLAHSMSLWYVVTPASCTTVGTEKRNCTSCKTYSETQNIPVLGHSYRNGVCQNCGDDLPLDCSCKCHNTGFFAKLIWKITIFFNKLLKRNKVCSCGVYHY